MSSVRLPAAELLEEDPDDYFDALAAYLQSELKYYQNLKLEAPNIEADHLIIVSYIFLVLREKQKQVKSALQNLEEELDTGPLQLFSRQLDNLQSDWFQNLLQSNQMVNLLGEIKIMRKQAKRLSSKIKRAQDWMVFKNIEQEADQIVGGAGFQSQIEAFAERGFEVTALWLAHQQMEKQIDKMRDAFDSVSDKLAFLS